MAALRRTAPEAGIEAMQQINQTVIKTQFVAGILLIAIFSVAFAVYAVFAFEGAARVAVILAPLVYIPSVFLMTLAGNVPMNNQLDALAHTSADGHAYWATYGRVWTRWNHVRTLGSVVVAGLFLLASVQLAAAAE